MKDFIYKEVLSWNIYIWYLYTGCLKKNLVYVERKEYVMKYICGIYI